jgi:integrase
MSRRRGTGSIFRKPGCATWVIQFYKDGRRIREATGLTYRAAAQRRLTTRLYQVDKNEYLERERRPVRIEELFTALEENNLSNGRGRPRDLRGRWRNLSQSFAAMRAINLTTDDVRHYVRRRQQEGASNATVNRELSALKRMLNFGRQSTPPKIQAIPYIPMLKENNVRVGFVDDESFGRLAAEASELWLRTFLELAYSYGWRRAELLGLRVRQVNFRERSIRLDVGTTKNRDGREVSMTAKVNELMGQAVKGKAAQDFVLTRKNGKPIKDFRKAWKDLTVRAGLPGLIVHDLRRSAAKALRAAGVPESVVMSIGGWKTPAMFRRYAIVSTADQRAAMEKLERARENSPYFGPYSPEKSRSLSAALREKVQ